MAHQRSLLAGFTDYTGVDLSDILEHLRQWRANTADVLRQLQDFEQRVLAKPTAFTNADAVVSYIGFFRNLFTRYGRDFDRLLAELPGGVRENHVETVAQLAASATLEDERCIAFKQDWVYRKLKDESLRPLLDDIYGETRDQLIDYTDLSNVAHRLKALVGFTASEPVLELKPGIWGFTLDLRALWSRIGKWWQSRRDA